MLESAWSEPQSGVTEELGLAMSPDDGGAALTLNPLRFCHHFASGDATPRQRCVMPKAQPSSHNQSDQRVPVYWDQTVPVWEGGGGAASATKRKAAASHGRGSLGRDSRRFVGGGRALSSDTASLENSGESCACSGRDDCDGRARSSSSEGVVSSRCSSRHPGR